MESLIGLLLLLLGTAKNSLAQAALEPINVSIQPAVFWGVPFWIAHKEGYFEELGLDISYEVFTSGAPQVKAAVEDKSWDVGGAGCVPNIIGGPQGIQLMAISNDESATSALVGTAVGAANWPNKQSNGPPVEATFPVAITANSTVHYAALKCLDSVFANYSSENNFIYQAPADVIQSLTEGNVDYGSLWAPNLYTVLDNVEGSSIVCSGDRVGATVPGGIMVREEFGNEKPELVARFLAGWLRGIGFLKNPRNRDQSTVYLREFNEETLPGSSISDSAIRQDFALRPMFDLDEQLRLFSRASGLSSTVDDWYIGVSDFLVENGVLSEAPAVEDYITDKYLELVVQNETLKEFTLKSSSGYIDPTEAGVNDNNQPGGNVDEASSAHAHLSVLSCVGVGSYILGFLI